MDPEILMHYGVPPYVIKLKREEYQTITVTFSSPPELLYIRTHDTQALDWVLKGRHLIMTVYCHEPAGFQRIVEHPIPIKWVGGGTLLRLWCPPEEDE